MLFFVRCAKAKLTAQKNVNQVYAWGVRLDSD